MNKNNTPGIERMSESVYNLSMINYKRSHLNKEPISTDEYEIPIGKIIHVTDSLFAEYADMTKVPMLGYLTKFTSKPSMTNVLQLPEGIEFDKKIRYIPSVVMRELITYKKKIKDVYKYKGSYIDALQEDIPISLSVNYYPLSRTDVRSGKYTISNMYETYMKTIVSNILSNANVDHHVHIPININLDDYYIHTYWAKNKLLPDVYSLNRYEQITTYFLLDLMCLLRGIDLKDKENILRNIPTTMYDKIYFTFINNSYNSIHVYKLTDLVTIIDGNKANYVKLIQQLSSMYVHDTSKRDILKENNVSKLKLLEIDTNITKDVTTNISKEVSNLITTTISDTDESIKDIEKMSKELTINPEEIDIDYVYDMIEDESNNELNISSELNKSKVSLEKHIEVELDRTLDNDTFLSPAQKDRVRRQYKEMLDKDIILGKEKGKISDILKKSTNKEVKSNKITKDKYGLDDTINKETVLGMEDDYVNNILDKDILKSLTTLSKNGLILKSLDEEVTDNKFNKVRQFTAKFNSIEGKTHTLRFKLPIIEDDHMVISGVKYSMRNQIVSLPICKVSESKVSLTSNFNKYFAERTSYYRRTLVNSVMKTIEKNRDILPRLKTVTGNSLYKGNKIMSIDHVNMASGYTSIHNGDMEFVFDYNEIYKILKLDDKVIASIEKYYTNKKWCLIGRSNRGYLFINYKTNMVYEYDMSDSKILTKGTIYQLLFQGKNINPVEPLEYCNLTILDKKLPIIILLGYKFGLRNILKEFNIKYRLYTVGKRVKLQPDDVAVKFSDFTLVFNRYPRLHGLLLNGLSIFNTKDVPLSSLDTKEGYEQLFTDKKIKLNMFKGIDAFFNFFLDPITIDVLKEMDEPTTMKGLLMRCVELLTTSEYTEPSELKHFRIRGKEKIPAILYYKIARQYSQHINNGKRDKQFSINTEDVFLSIISDNAVTLHEDINPYHDLKTRTGVTHSGFGGRTDESFVEKDRKFPRDGVGIISEAVPDSGKVGVNFNISPNATIKNTRGMFSISEDITNLDNSSILSTSALVTPGIVNNDPKRANFTSIQHSHVVPQYNSSVGRVRTGYESMIPNMVGSTYSIRAEEDGKITTIDEDNNLLIVTYKSGDKRAYEIGTKIGEASGSLINHKLVMTDGYKEGSIFKKDSILAYNEGFFTYDKHMKEHQMKGGTYATVALVENPNVIEDASALTKEFASKMTFEVSKLRTLKLTIENTIEDYRKVGEYIKFDEPLCKISYMDINHVDVKTGKDDEDVNYVLDELQSSTTLAKLDGKIIDINIYYTCDKSDFSSSIQKFIKYVETYKSLKDKKLSDVSNKEKLSLPSRVEPNTRIRKKALEEDTILIEYVVAKDDKQGIGSKIVFGTCLKSVQSQVYDTPPVGYTTGRKIDADFSTKSNFNRIVNGDTKVGIIEASLEHIEQELIEKFKDF